MIVLFLLILSLIFIIAPDWIADSLCPTRGVGESLELTVRWLGIGGLLIALWCLWRLGGLLFGIIVSIVILGGWVLWM